MTAQADIAAIEDSGFNTAAEVRAALSSVLDRLAAGYAELFITAPAATAIANTTDYFDLAGTWELGQASNFDQPTPGQLRYLGTETLVAEVYAVATLTPSTNQDLIHLRLEKNGADVPGSNASLSLKQTTEREEATIIALVSLAQNDVLNLAIRNESTAAAVAADEGHMVVKTL